MKAGMEMEKTGEFLPLGPLLGHAAHLARERMDARLSRYDVTPAQTHTLLYLCGHGDCAPQRDVVAHLRVKPSTANGILDRMEEKGLIRRAADAERPAAEAGHGNGEGAPAAGAGAGCLSGHGGRDVPESADG